MSTLRVSNIEAKADVSSPSVHEKIKVTNSEGDVLVHIDGATSGISTVGINTTVKTFDVDSNQNIDFVGNLTAPNITVTGTLSYDDVTNIDSVGVITARSGLEVTSGGLQVTGGNVGIGLTNPDWHLDIKSTSVNAVVRLKSSGSTNGGQLQVNSDDLILRNRDAGNLQLWTNDTERLRIDSTGRLLKSGQATLNSTSLSHPIQVASASDANAIAIIGRAADDIGELSFYEADKSTKLGELQYRQDHLNFRHRVGYISFATGGLTERLRITSAGDVQARRPRSNTVGEVALSIQPTDSTIHYGFRIDQTNNNLNLDRVGSGNVTTFRNDGLIFAKALHVTDNLTPTSGRGVEIFAASAGVGLIQSYNRDGTSFDELRFRGSEVRLYSNTNLRLDVQNAQSYLYGTSDGILNLDTTDGRGSFIRFKENGTTKAWVGCAEGMGGGTSAPNQDDLGLRATRHILCSANGAERLRITNTATAVHVKGESALTGTTGDAKGLSIGVNGANSCPLYFGTETHSAQKSMYMHGYWIYLRGHQNEGIRFVFSQGSGNAPRSDQYQFKYNQATRPTGNTTWDGFSDRRAKENVQDVTSALDTIGRLRPVTFDWTNDYADRMNMFNMDKTDPKSYNWFSVKENGYDESRKNNNVGFIAQEFEEVFPKDITETEMELGGETITDFKTVNFDSLVPMLTKAVQELKAENDSLRARLDAAGL